MLSEWLIKHCTAIQRWYLLCLCLPLFFLFPFVLFLIIYLCVCFYYVFVLFRWTIQRSAKVQFNRSAHTLQQWIAAWCLTSFEELMRLLALFVSCMVCVLLFNTAFCVKCGKHEVHNVSQYKAGKARLTPQGTQLALSLSLFVFFTFRYTTRFVSPSFVRSPGKRRYDRKCSGFGGQPKPVFHKKVDLLFATLTIACSCSPLCVIFIIDFFSRYFVLRQKRPRKLPWNWNARPANTLISSRLSVVNILNSVAKRRRRINLSSKGFLFRILFCICQRFVPFTL